MCPIIETEAPDAVKRKRKPVEQARVEIIDVKPKEKEPKISQGFIERKAKEMHDEIVAGSRNMRAPGFWTSGQAAAPPKEEAAGRFDMGMGQMLPSISLDKLKIPSDVNTVGVGRVTHYYVADRLSDVAMQGTGYVNGKWWHWNGHKVTQTDGVHGAYKKGSLVSMREWSTSMKEWYAQGATRAALESVEPMSVAGGKDKAKHYQVVVTDAGYIFQRVDDTGGAFPKGTSKRDWYLGLKAQAKYDHAELAELGAIKVSKGVFVTNGKTYEFEPKDLQGALDFIMELERQGFHAVTLK